MKTTKKILASLLVIMMLAMMIPFSASAADSYTATYVCNPDADKAGDYTFGFFKIASLELKEGKYTVVDALKGTDVETAINAPKSEGKTQSIITACDALYDTNAAFASYAKSISFSKNVTEQSVTFENTEAGIYYIYCTDKPATVTGVNNSLVALPYYSNNSWIAEYDSFDEATGEVNLASKISTSPVKVTKTADKTYIGDNDPTVTYTLTASTAGSMQNKLTKYAIVDTMDAGLTLDEDTIVVTLDNTTLTKGTDYTILKNCKYKDADKNEKTATFAVVLTNSMLNSEAFYNADTVKVVYEANINDNAKLATAMPNSDGLVYGNTSGLDTDNINDSDLNYEDGDEVNVFTYGMKVQKVDGTTNKGLSDTEFTVYTDAEATTPLMVNGEKVIAVTNSDGKATFKLESVAKDDNAPAFKFDIMDDVKKTPITYYVKETKAKDGYTICDTIFTVDIKTSNEYTSVNDGNPVKNYPVVIPQTGGMGTMLFTIGGALLIACAGVLFLIVRRKNNA